MKPDKKIEGKIVKKVEEEKEIEKKVVKKWQTFSN